MDELRDLTTVTRCFLWAGLTDLETASARTVLGFAENEAPRVFGAADEADLGATLQAWRLPDTSIPTLALRSKVRLAWRAAQKASGMPSASNSSGEGLQSTILGDANMVRLDGAVKKELLRKFAANYVTELLTDSSTPSDEVLRKFYSMRLKGQWVWVPWNQLLSKSQAEVLKDKRKQSKHPEHTLLRIMASNAGLDEVDEESMTGSPFRIQQALNIRATSMAIIGICHLNSAKSYVAAFMDKYTQKPFSADMRQPALDEAEAADREVWRELLRLHDRGTTFDDAIYEIVFSRDMLTTHLASRQRPPEGHKRRAHEMDSSKGHKGTKGAAPKGKGKGGKDKWPDWPPRGDNSGKGDQQPKGAATKGKGKGTKADQAGKGAAQDNTCWRWIAGNCNAGSTCRFSHDGVPTPSNART
jgi:hypothetical protein